MSVNPTPVSSAATGTVASVARTAPAKAPGFLRRLFSKPLGAFSTILLLLIVVTSLMSPILAPYAPAASDYSAVLQGPSPAHLLGTDTLGRDLLSRILYAGTPAFLDVVVAVAVTFVLAVPVGITVGLVRGWTDVLATRVSEVIMAIPGITILLMVLALFKQNMILAMVGLGILATPGVLRVVRSAAIGVSEEPYIDAARVAGVGTVRIIFRHILPRVTGVIVVNLSLIASAALLVAAGLNFLGLGAQPPAASYGGMVAEAGTVLNRQPWMMVPVAGIIALAVIGLVLFGDSLRDVLIERWAGSSNTRDRARSARDALASTESVDGDLAATFMAEKPLARVRNLTIGFPSSASPAGWQPVLTNVSFDIAPGETVGLVGESGCGKTMTGLGVLGLLPQGAHVMSGSVDLDGAETTGMSERARARLRGTTVAYISQEPMVALDPLYTVGNQIGEAVRRHARLRGTAVRRRVLELLEQVQIVDPPEVMKKYPFEISGGMAQRVAIAIALAGSPKLLIADEPTTALDVTVQAEIITLLRKVQAETGMSILLISHDWGVISELCDRSIVMYAGQMVEYGETPRILEAPRHPYSNGLITANPRYATPGQLLPTIKGTVPKPADWPVGCRFRDRCPLATEACAEAPIPLRALGDTDLSRCIRIDELMTLEAAR